MTRGCCCSGLVYARELSHPLIPILPGVCQGLISPLSCPLRPERAANGPVGRQLGLDQIAFPVARIVELKDKFLTVV